jgi:hypothetical protein
MIGLSKSGRMVWSLIPIVPGEAWEQCSLPIRAFGPLSHMQKSLQEESLPLFTALSARIDFSSFINGNPGPEFARSVLMPHLPEVFAWRNSGAYSESEPKLHYIINDSQEGEVSGWRWVRKGQGSKRSNLLVEVADVVENLHVLRDLCEEARERIDA